ncbi:MAG: hypothetical protein ACE5KT_05100 [Methanosarcinales archaeon]
MENKMICECGTEMHKDIEHIELIENTGLKGDIEVYRCPKCGEIELTEEQLRSYRSKANKFRVKRKIDVSDDELVLKIPEDVSKYYGIDRNTEVNIILLDKKRFIVEV